MLPIGLLFVGLVVRTILGVAIVSALVIFLCKFGKVADVYADILKNKH